MDASGKWRFNFMDWEASRPGEGGGGLTMNIVALLDEIAWAIGRSARDSGHGSDRFWRDALHNLNTNLVDLLSLTGVEISLPLLHSILNSAPQNPGQCDDAEWNEKSNCAAALRGADQATLKADPDIRADFEECQTYWLKAFPALSEKTRSVIVLMLSMLIRPFVTRPLRKLFSTDTNITPEAAFDGKVIIIDLPVQEFRLAGRVANLVWKYCFQIAVLRRKQPTEENSFLRPVFLFADEAQNFISDFDATYQAWPDPRAAAQSIARRLAKACVTY